MLHIHCLANADLLHAALHSPSARYEVAARPIFHSPQLLRQRFVHVPGNHHTYPYRHLTGGSLWVTI